MKKLSVLAIALMFVVFGSYNVFAAGEGGLLADYSFETTALLGGDGWIEQGTIGSIDVSSVDKYSGTKSVKFTNVTAAATGRYILSDTFAVSASTVYSAAVRALATADGSASVRVRIHWYTAQTGTAALSTATSGNVSIPAATTWTRVNLDNQTSPATAAYAVLEIGGLESVDVGNDMFIDDACFIQAATSVDNWKEIK